MATMCISVLLILCRIFLSILKNRCMCMYTLVRLSGKMSGRLTKTQSSSKFRLATSTQLDHPELVAVLRLRGRAGPSNYTQQDEVFSMHALVRGRVSQGQATAQ